jgi:hypothetical protein
MSLEDVSKILTVWKFRKFLKFISIWIVKSLLNSFDQQVQIAVFANQWFLEIIGKLKTRLEF